MTMPRPIRASLLLAMLVATPVQAGLFSKAATSVAEIHDTARPMSVAAPDDSMRAVARYMEGKLTVFVGVKGFDFAGGADAELLWAPDSQALAVTSNDGGSEAGAGEGAAEEDRFLATILVRQSARKWKRIDVTRRIAALLPPPRGCNDAAPLDVAALGWTSGRRLIVAAARWPGRTCGARRRVVAFIVDVPSGDILMALDERAVQRRYHGLMGEALRRRDWRRERAEAPEEPKSGN